MTVCMKQVSDGHEPRKKPAKSRNESTLTIYFARYDDVIFFAFAQQNVFAKE